MRNVRRVAWGAEYVTFRQHSFTQRIDAGDPVDAGAGCRQKSRAPTIFWRRVERNVVESGQERLGLCPGDAAVMQTDRAL
jgi:hypothetical protein